MRLAQYFHVAILILCHRQLATIPRSAAVFRQEFQVFAQHRLELVALGRHPHGRIECRHDAAGLNANGAGDRFAHGKRIALQAALQVDHKTQRFAILEARLERFLQPGGTAGVRHHDFYRPQIRQRHQHRGHYRRLAAGNRKRQLGYLLLHDGLDRRHLGRGIVAGQRRHQIVGQHRDRFDCARRRHREPEGDRALHFLVFPELLAQPALAIQDHLARRSGVQRTGHQRRSGAQVADQRDAPFDRIHAAFDGLGAVHDAVVEQQQLVEMGRHQLIQHLAVDMVFLVARHAVAHQQRLAAGKLPALPARQRVHETPGAVVEIAVQPQRAAVDHQVQVRRAGGDQAEVIYAPLLHVLHEAAEQRLRDHLLRHGAQVGVHLRRAEILPADGLLVRVLDARIEGRAHGLGFSEKIAHYVLALDHPASC
ncbi:hypothetical protein CFU_2178 [Collimonas fungivorans Ter331]|uniref:Uncharacterized protein n=1 Tax=Collimonas fungivorans (strain Ter331) TaxID=1005048 RepID=G0AH03_COLFT|nr:hypothetical protein CFU_2178 [Collimonas fungivorans Ter331]